MIYPDSYFVGLDLGQAQDYTALAILERPSLRRQDPDPVYDLRHLMRFDLGTSYPAIVDSLCGTLRREPLDRAFVCLAVDATGVGAAVVDMIRPRLPGMAAITITGGREIGVQAGGYTVPKLHLVGTMQVLLQNRRLRISSALPAAATLVKELEAFRVKVNVATGNESFEAWRERDHDDLVLAVALAGWLGERFAAEERDAGDDFHFDVFRVGR